MASESLENQGFQEPEIEQSGKSRKLSFEQINEVTWKLTDGGGTIAWNGDRSGGYRTTRAIAWLVGLGGGKWVVRYRNKASKPMRLPKARAYALEMVRGVWAGRILADPLRNLHQEYLKTMGEEPRPAPLNIMGVSHQWGRPCRVDRETLAEILRSECPTLIDANPIQPALPAVHGDDYQLEYDSFGHPEIPECLRRAR